MNAGTIWWGRMGTSIRFLNRVTDCLQESRSVILQLPERFPWREQFYEQIDFRRERFSIHRRLVRMDWRAGDSPGSFVLRELCPRSVQADYWPGQTVAEYLGSLGTLELCGFYVWIRGLRSREDLISWADFTAKYEAASSRLERRAVFVLEYEGPAHHSASLPSAAYQCDEYDTRAFCLELSSEGRDTVNRGYLVELAVRIGGDDPELCAALLSAGQWLPEDPVSVAQSVLSEQSHSDGQPFARMEESGIASVVWRAAVVLLFPVLEGFRFAFISRHASELARYLPITNSNGDRVTEPFDLELGSLFYVVSTASYAFSPEEAEQVSLCRNVRNLLAHNKPVPYRDVEAVLSLQS